MAPAKPSHLYNPLATVEELAATASRLDGIPSDLEISLRFAGARLTQSAGILLRLPQDIIAQAIVLFTRFYTGPEGGSFRQYDVKDVSASALYLAAKLSASPQSPRSVLNVYAYLLSERSCFWSRLDEGEETDPEPASYYMSEGRYFAQRQTLMKTEAQLLRVLGFVTHVALPYTLAINYLQALDIFGRPNASSLAQRTFAHLTTALFSPQLLYLTHQPPALATAAIYLSAREVGIKLPSEQWWEVFDVDREELGFLVVALKSMENFAAAEKGKWGKRKVPFTAEDVDGELEDRQILDNVN